MFHNLYPPKFQNLTRSLHFQGGLWACSLLHHEGACISWRHCCQPRSLWMVSNKRLISTPFSEPQKDSAMWKPIGGGCPPIMTQICYPHLRQFSVNRFYILEQTSLIVNQVYIIACTDIFQSIYVYAFSGLFCVGRVHWDCIFFFFCLDTHDMMSMFTSQNDRTLSSILNHTTWMWILLKVFM